MDVDNKNNKNNKSVDNKNEKENNKIDNNNNKIDNKNNEIEHKNNKDNKIDQKNNKDTDSNDIFKNGDINDWKKELKNFESISEDLLNHLVEIAPNKECANAIVEEYNERKYREIKQNGQETHSYDKPRNYGTKIEKGAAMLTESFKNNVEGYDHKKCYKICLEIAKLTHEKYPDVFPKMIRTKIHNLKENKELCREVYDGKRDPEEVVLMSTEEMKSERLRSKDEESIKNGLLDAQRATREAETEMFKCSKCGQRKCTYSQLQTRSCDEPMTTFVHCTVCGHRWKF